MKKTFLTVTAVMFVALSIGVSAVCWACSDDFMVSTSTQENGSSAVIVAGENDVGNRAGVRDVGVWVKRMEYLVPMNSRVEFVSGYLTVYTGDQDEPALTLDSIASLAEAFDALVKHYNVSATDADEARRHTIRPLTIQVASFLDVKSARAYATQAETAVYDKVHNAQNHTKNQNLPDLDLLKGYYNIDYELFILVESTAARGSRWGVHVGAFYTKADAQAALQELGRLGYAGVIRPI